MSEGIVHEGSDVEEANRRYWTTDASVNQIADDLGLSKSSLYSMIRQLDAGVACPECGTEVVYPNRTARDRGIVLCTSCGFEGAADEALELTAEREMGIAPYGGTAPSARVVTGAALLGLAAGIVIGSLARRR